MYNLFQTLSCGKFYKFYIQERARHLKNIRNDYLMGWFEHSSRWKDSNCVIECQ